MKASSGIGLENKICLLKITKWCYLNADIRLPLCSSFKITRSGFCINGQYQNGHLDMVLQNVQKHHDARFTDLLLMMLKVSITLIWSKSTICNISYFFIFLLCFLYSVGGIMSLEMCSNTHYHASMAKIGRAHV